MPTFVIKTADPAVDFAIEAEEFNLTRDNTYAFYDEECELVAELNAGQVLAVVREDNLLTPNYEDEDLEDDVCDDCRTNELLEDPAFCNAVFDLIEGWHEQPSEVEPSAPEPEGAQPAEATPNYPVEYRKTLLGRPRWGISDVERSHFVPFGSKASAKGSVVTYAKSPNGWAVETLSDCPLVEVPSNG
jgi:hypothetical protein